MKDLVVAIHLATETLFKRRKTLLSLIRDKEKKRKYFDSLRTILNI